MRSRQRTVVVLAAVALVATVVVGAEPSAGAGAATEPRCHDEQLTVTLPSGGAQTLAGTLCLPTAGPPPATVQVLLPGGTYDRIYWDWSHQPATYSYVRAATTAGYASFAVDRLGTGSSDRPAGTLLTNESHAATIAQVVAALRDGRLGEQAFPHVVLVGHSYGSIMAWYTAAAHGNVDAVVVTGLLHRMGLGFTPLYPAALDPAFAGEIRDPTYLTTLPGGRATFHAVDADPALVALDEATKDTTTTAEILGIPVALSSGISGQVDVPVFVAVGRQDGVFCAPLGSDCTSAATVRAGEQDFYAAAPCLETFVLEGSGHDLTAARNAPTFFAATTTWLDRVVGPDGTAPGCP